VIVDTSILIAVLLQEAGWEELFERLKGESSLSISSATYVELHIVLLRRLHGDWAPLVQSFFTDLRIQVVAFDAEQARVAAQAYRAFGKGRHPAGLNFGDCFAYALAKTWDEPLLFKGDDFGKTDVRVP
jgi:ribonuclease VapC